MLVSDRATKFQVFWKAVSDVPASELAQFIRWGLRFDDGLIEKAIMKTAAKFNRTGTDSERAHRYATKLLFNLLGERDRTLSTTHQETNTMTDPKTPKPEQAVAQIGTAYNSNPNHFQDLARKALQSGEITGDSTIADVRTVLDQHNAVRQ